MEPIFRQLGAFEQGVSELAVVPVDPTEVCEGQIEVFHTGFSDLCVVLNESHWTFELVPCVVRISLKMAWFREGDSTEVDTTFVSRDIQGLESRPSLSGTQDPLLESCLSGCQLQHSARVSAPRFLRPPGAESQTHIAEFLPQFGPVWWNRIPCSYALQVRRGVGKCSSMGSTASRVSL